MQCCVDIIVVYYSFAISLTDPSTKNTRLMKTPKLAMVPYQARYRMVMSGIRAAMECTANHSAKNCVAPQLQLSHGKGVPRKRYKQLEAIVER